MKQLLSLLVVAMVGMVLVGCEAGASVGTNPPANTSVHDRTVTDANGNTVSHSETVNRN